MVRHASSHNTIAAYGWIKKGHARKAQSNTGQQRRNINGAGDIGTWQSHGGLRADLNALTMLTLFRKRRKILPVHQQDLPLLR